MPPEELANLPGLHPSMVELPYVAVDPLDLVTDDRRRLFIVDQLSPPQSHLQGLADVIAEDGKLFDVSLDLLESLSTKELVLFPFGDIPSSRLDANHLPTLQNRGFIQLDDRRSPVLAAEFDLEPLDRLAQRQLLLCLLPRGERERTYVVLTLLADEL